MDASTGQPHVQGAQAPAGDPFWLLRLWETHFRQRSGPSVVLKTRNRWTDRHRRVSRYFQDRVVPMDFLVLTPSEIKKRLDSFDPFLSEILNKGKVLYRGQG